MAQDHSPLALPPPPKPAPRQRDRARAAWLALLLVVVIALVGSSPFWAGWLGGVLPWSPQLTAKNEASETPAPLDERLGEIARREAALEQRFAEVADQSAAIRAIEERVAALERAPRGSDPAELAGLKTALGAVAEAAAQNGERLAELEARRSAAAGRSDAALLLAVGQLRAQLQTSQSFAAELAAVTALGHHEPQIEEAVQRLAPSAAKGIPSLAVLSQRFAPEVVPAVLHPAADLDSEGWSGWFLAKLRRLVTIRSAGGSGAAPRDPADAALGRAEAALAAGDLAGAVAAVESLPAPEAAGAWLADARRRLAAETTAARLGEAVTARLAEEDHGGGAAGER